MSTNIIDAYIDFSVKSIEIYNTWLLEYLYEKRKSSSILKTITTKTIRDYIHDEIVCNHFTKIVDIDKKIYLTQQNYVDEKLNTIKFFLTKNTNCFDKTKEDEKFLKEYLNLSNSILIAIELNKWANLIAKNCSFEEAINKIVREHKECFDESIIKKLKMKMPFLKKEYQSRQKTFEKIINHYEKSSIDFDTIKLLNNINNENYYMIYPLYNLKQLKYYDKRKVEEIIEEQKVARDILLITLDKLNYQTLKHVLLDKNIPNYILTIKNGMFKSKTILKEIQKNYININLKTNIFFMFDYIEYKKYKNSIDELSNYVSIILTNLDNKYDVEILKNIRFLSLNNKNLKDKKLMEIVQKNNITIIYNQENNDPIENNMFVKESESKRVSKRIMYE